MPNEILQGRIEPQYNIDDYVKECKMKMQLIYKETKELIERIKESNKKNYDKNTNPIKLKFSQNCQTTI